MQRCVSAGSHGYGAALPRFLLAALPERVRRTSRPRAPPTQTQGKTLSIPRAWRPSPRPSRAVWRPCGTSCRRSPSTTRAFIASRRSSVPSFATSSSRRTSSCPSCSMGSRGSARSSSARTAAAGASETRSGRASSTCARQRVRRIWLSSPGFCVRSRRPRAASARARSAIAFAASSSDPPSTSPRGPSSSRASASSRASRRFATISSTSTCARTCRS